MSHAAELSEPGGHESWSDAWNSSAESGSLPPFEPVDICRLDVFRVVIEVCRQLKRREAAIIVGAAKWAVDTITRGARHVVTLPVSSGKKI